MMPTPPSPDVRALQGQLRRGGALLWLGLTMIGGALRQVLWLALRRVFGVVFALIVLFEQWGWRPLAAALNAISHLAPVAAAERVIRNLPPYAALVTFALPTALLVLTQKQAMALTGKSFSALPAYEWLLGKP